MPNTDQPIEDRDPVTVLQVMAALRTSNEVLDIATKRFSPALIARRIDHRIRENDRLLAKLDASQVLRAKAEARR